MLNLQTAKIVPGRLFVHIGTAEYATQLSGGNIPPYNKYDVKMFRKCYLVVGLTTSRYLPVLTREAQTEDQTLMTRVATSTSPSSMYST